MTEHSTGTRAEARPEEAPSERPAPAEEPVEAPNEGAPGEFEPQQEPGDEESAGEAEPAAGDESPADEDELARTRAERDEYLALAQRVQADFDNYRKRAAKEVAAAGARGRADVLRELLPVVDNLERALALSDEDGDRGVVEGVRLVHSELVGALQRNGVEPIDPAGERFDPNVHEALSTRAGDGDEAGVVLDVVQKGYRLEAVVLRPARVVVAA